jgi:hypothetical protein
MKTGNIADNRVGLAPNPEVTPKVVKKTLTKKATANAKPTPKKPSPSKNKSVPVLKAPNASKKAKAPAKVVAKKKTNANAKTKNNAPKYRFNSPSNQELSANNMEDLFRLYELPGLSRLEFKRQMK